MDHLKAAALAGLALAAARPAAAGPRVMSLDQCADQYVMALAPRPDIAAVSFRADAYDSYLRADAARLPRRRASLEAVLAARPQLVVRNWGGDEQMVRRLRARGVRVVEIADAADFAGVRADVRRVAAALGRPAAGEALVAGLDRELAMARGAWDGRSVLYLTPGGFTAGRGTMVGAMIASAGLTPAAAGSGYAPVSLERLAARPPSGFVLGFFDRPSMGRQRWSVGRRRVLQTMLHGRTLAALPAAILGCPGWFAADGARDLAAARPR